MDAVDLLTSIQTPYSLKSTIPLLWYNSSLVATRTAWRLAENMPAVPLDDQYLVDLGLDSDQKKYAEVSWVWTPLVSRGSIISPKLGNRIAELLVNGSSEAIPDNLSNFDIRFSIPLCVTDHSCRFMDRWEAVSIAFANIVQANDSLFSDLKHSKYLDPGTAIELIDGPFKTEVTENVLNFQKEAIDCLVDSVESKRMNSILKASKVQFVQNILYYFARDLFPGSENDWETVSGSKQIDLIEGGFSKGLALGSILILLFGLGAFSHKELLDWPVPGFETGLWGFLASIEPLSYFFLGEVTFFFIVLIISAAVLGSFDLADFPIITALILGWPVTFYILLKENVGGNKNWLSFFKLDAEEAILFVGSLLLLPIIPLCGVYVFFFSSQFLPVGYAFVVAFIGSLPMFIISFVMIYIDLNRLTRFVSFLPPLNLVLPGSLTPVFNLIRHPNETLRSAFKGACTKSISILVRPFG